MEDEHRCRRCGRRLGEAVVNRTTGALATAAEPARYEVSSDPDPQPRASADPQGYLFGERAPSNIIPFESLPGARLELRPRPAPLPAPPSRPSAPPRRHAPPARKPDNQPGLDFLPPAPQAPRTLGTTVEAVIYCDAPVATVMHRSVAAALDAAMVLIAFGLFLAAFDLGGGEFRLSAVSGGIFASAFLVITLFYGFLWLLAGSETAGMRWTHLKLTNFDGFPPERSQRALRYAGTCLSYAAAGLGILWALVDEESLTWQDHISKTFLTLSAPETNFVRRR